MNTTKIDILQSRLETATELLAECHLCPRECKVNRTQNIKGICKTGKNIMVSSYCSHFGEEAPLVGKNGSGTIFFTNCNLLCNFCQNYDISHQQQGTEISEKQLAEIMLELQQKGCHNINLVTPSHVVPQIMSTLLIAFKNGLNLPIIYNSSGYDKVSTLKLLDGIIDIYMPDFKFWDDPIANETTGTNNYAEMARNAIKEMHRQVGDLKTNLYGIAEKGILIRHLILPNDLAGTKNIMKFLASEVSSNTYVNIMAQYRPSGEVYEHKDLSRKITIEEYRKAIELAEIEGITRLDSVL